MSEALLGSELDAMVTRYLEELHEALRHLPASQRDHLITEIREHIAYMRAERPVRDRSDMEALLNRVGLPEDIAAVALEGVEDSEVEVDVAEPPYVAPSEPRFLGGRMSKRTFKIGTAAVAAAVVVLGSCAGVAIVNHGGQVSFAIVQHRSTAEPVFVKPPVPYPGEVVPDVIGASQAQAEAILTSGRFGFMVSYMPSTAVLAGHVMSQNPKPGTVVRHPGLITIVVSSGPPATTS